MLLVSVNIRALQSVDWFVYQLQIYELVTFSANVKDENGAATGAEYSTEANPKSVKVLIIWICHFSCVTTK